jgi:retinol dehydrogenase-12
MPSLRFLARHFWPFGVPEPESDLSGLTAIVTGATSGLGYATAEYLVEHSISTLVIGCVDLEKGTEIKDKLLSLASDKDKCQIHVWKLDLGSFDSVIAFHKQVQQLENVHFFISCAGVVPGEDWKFSEDGWEES